MNSHATRTNAQLELKLERPITKDRPATGEIANSPAYPPENVEESPIFLRTYSILCNLTYTFVQGHRCVAVGLGEVNGVQYRALIDEQDVPLVAAHPWRLKPSGDTHYAVARRVRMHRLILGAPDGIEVDHANGDGLDNRRSNLRLATRSQQMRNRRPWGRSRFKGVSWHVKKWQAKICVSGRDIALGLFEDEVEAARAYDRAALQHFGQFAKTNAMLGLLPEGGA